MPGAAATPHTWLAGVSASIVSSGTSTESGCGSAALWLRTAGPVAADHAAAPGRIPRVRVTRRYSTDTIDGGSGDCRRRPVTVRPAAAKTRECTGAVEVTRSADVSCEIHRRCSVALAASENSARRRNAFAAMNRSDLPPRRLDVTILVETHDLGSQACRDAEPRIQVRFAHPRWRRRGERGRRRAGPGRQLTVDRRAHDGRRGGIARQQRHVVAGVDQPRSQECRDSSGPRAARCRRGSRRVAVERRAAPEPHRPARVRAVRSSGSRAGAGADRDPTAGALRAGDERATRSRRSVPLRTARSSTPAA